MRIGRLSVSAVVLAVGLGIAPTGPAALAAGSQPGTASTATTTSTARAVSTAGAASTAATTSTAGAASTARARTATAASTAAAVSTAGAASTGPLCGSMAGTRPHITKVMWIFMENRSYGTGKGEIPGDPSAQYIDGTLIRHCGSTSDYHGITHASFPNYLAATSGGLHGDGSQHSYSVRSIFSQVDPSWRSYEEFMPVPCDHVPQVGNPATGQYYVNRHNPAAFYSSQPVSGDCTQFDRRLGSANTGALARAVSAGKLPRFSFVTPGLCDDMHLLPPGVAGCANPTASGDAWLATWIPIITAGRDYQKGRLVIDITWDEGSGGKISAHCLTSNAANCIVPDIVISPYTRHKVVSRDLSHYSLLKMTERLLGLHFLGRARNTTVRNLCRPFGLCPRRH